MWAGGYCLQYERHFHQFLERGVELRIKELRSGSLRPSQSHSQNKTNGIRLLKEVVPQTVTVPSLKAWICCNKFSQYLRVGRLSAKGTSSDITQTRHSTIIQVA